MSDNMIEQVAKAIHAYDFPTKILKWEDTTQKYYTAIADVAIKAMKEPTEAMLNAGAYDLDMTLKQQWKLMIEAALK